MLVPLLLACSEDGGLNVSGFVGDATVVILTALVVSADGGGGRFARSGRVGRTCARQRKHSPLPKKCGDGWGASERYAPKIYTFVNNASNQIFDWMQSYPTRGVSHNQHKSTPLPPIIFGHLVQRCKTDSILFQTIRQTPLIYQLQSRRHK